MKIYYGEKQAQKAELEFDAVFKNKELPTDVEIFETDKKRYLILDLLVDTKLVPSKNEAKRLIDGGGVTINSEIKIGDWKQEITIEDGMVVRAGKRRFVKIKLK